MTLLDARGNPIEPEELHAEVDRCTTCGATDLEHERGFGGYYTVRCRKCFTTLDRGRNDRT